MGVLCWFCFSHGTYQQLGKGSLLGMFYANGYCHMTCQDEALGEHIYVSPHTESTRVKPYRMACRRCLNQVGVFINTEMGMLPSFHRSSVLIGEDTGLSHALSTERMPLTFNTSQWKTLYSKHHTLIPHYKVPGEAPLDDDAPNRLFLVDPSCWELQHTPILRDQRLSPTLCPLLTVVAYPHPSNPTHLHWELLTSDRSEGPTGVADPI